MSDIPRPNFPAGVGISHLRVYESPGPDGLAGGSAHFHACCSEAYLCSGGIGRVQTLSLERGFREFELKKGKVVWFTPGVLHRLVNDGDLELFVLMQNGGLPEAGDAILTFPPELMGDSKRYFELASLAATGHVYAGNLEAAEARRDLAVEGFNRLHKELAAGNTDALNLFYTAALRLIRDKIPRWRRIYEEGALSEARGTKDLLDAVEKGDVEPLFSAGVEETSLVPDSERKFGMCGMLSPYLPEGVRQA